MQGSLVQVVRGVDVAFSPGSQKIVVLRATPQRTARTSGPDSSHCSAQGSCDTVNDAALFCEPRDDASPVSQSRKERASAVQVAALDLLSPSSASSFLSSDRECV